MSKKLRFLSFILALAMVISSAPIVPAYAQEEQSNTVEITNPFTSDTPLEINGQTVTSKSYRIPAMVTLADGTIVAAADIRWNTTYDGGCLDTLVARSTDGGATWSYTVANYLGDNGNTYNSQSTAFIDSCLTVAKDGKTVYLLCDLYPYGIALNGNGSQKTPATDVGFTEEGYLKLSNNDHSSYDFYLKDRCIYNSSNVQVAGYHVDEYFNLFNESNEKVSNLFFADSPYKVVRTGFLYLTSSTDGGANWSAPTLLDLKNDTENVCLSSPGSGITTANGTMIFPVYSYSTQTQKLGFLFSTDSGATWQRSKDFDSIWASESAVVEIGEGTLRFFFRNQQSTLCYVDYNMDANAWSSYINTGVKTNSNTQLSAITYSKTFNGSQVVLVSCPTGPNEAGSANSDGSYRSNGKIFMGVVAADGSMSWPKSIRVSTTTATAQLSSPYTEEKGFFAYSCLTERADGSIAILYENNQNGWGATGDTYFTITAKAYSGGDFSLPFDGEKVIDRTATLRDGVASVTLYADPSDSGSATVNATVDNLPEIMAVSGMYYDEASGTLFYKVRAAVGFEWPEAYSTYSYIPADTVDLRTDYGIAIPIVDFTNAAPLLGNSVTPQAVTYNLRSAARTLSLSKAATNTSGLVLDKSVTDNGNGTYTVNLEAYTTGTVTVQQATKPMDIVLVLDQSGSMAYCIGCGSNNPSVSSGEYHTEYDVLTDGIYYLRFNNSYSRLYYCSTCSGWHTSQTHSETTYQPKESQYSYGTTFYEACESRYDALIDALNTFVGAVRTKSLNAGSDPVDHRIAIVGFSSDNYNNTELLTGVTINTVNNTNPNNVNNNTKYYPDNKAYNGVQYDNITDAQYQAALQDMSTTTGYGNVTSAIDALTAHGGTQTLDGMDMAYEILNNDSKKNEEGREKVVILFTDGATNSNRGDLLNKAYDIKDDFGATIYSVGIFDGADGNLSSYEDDIDDDNSLMHLISSNYPDAQYSRNSWPRLNEGELNSTLSGDDSYYLSASDSAALNDIFQAMSSQIGSTSMDLGTQTVVKDIVTPQFDLPEGVSSVTVKQVDCLTFNDDTGVATWGTETVLSSADTVQIDPSTNSVSVTGFNFKHNYVAENGRDENDATKEGSFHGRKLVVTFVITPDPYFLGGDDVSTNGTESGVYDKDGTLVGKFEEPTVNVPLKDITTVVNNKHIYLGNTTDLSGVLDLWVKTNTSSDLRINADGINNAYVNLVYTVTLGGNEVATYTIPAGKQWAEGTWAEINNSGYLQNMAITTDTAFAISCKMTSVSNDANFKQATGTATVYVYKPVLTFADSEAYYQESVNSMDSHWKDTVWQRSDNTLSTAVPMEGTMPSLTLEYSYPDGSIVDGKAKVKTDIPVRVKVTITGNGSPITCEYGDSRIEFVHDTCVHPDCGFDPKAQEFLIHILLRETSLTIYKEGYSGYETIDPNQSFLFHVEGDGVNLVVTVHGNSSVTVNGLKVGNRYTVTELIDWSWRYEFSKWVFVSGDAAGASGTENAATVTLGTDGNKITFTNTRSENKWLDGDNWLDNLFKGN